MKPIHRNGRDAQPRREMPHHPGNYTNPRAEAYGNGRANGPVDPDPGELRSPALYADLLTAGHADGLKSIHTELVQLPTDDNGQFAVVKAVIETDQGEFCAYGDASPFSVEADYHPHILRCAETRAKARALRDALGIGTVSWEELSGEMKPDWSPRGPAPTQSRSGPPRTSRSPRTPTPPNRHTGNVITDKQRRLLFRLAYEAGYEGEEAAEFLRRELGVEDLNRADKHAASQLIDRLGHGNGNGGEAGYGS